VGDFFFPAPTASAAMPNVEDGLALARFDDVNVQEHEEWATDNNAFGKSDDGQRTHFVFTLMESKTKEVFGEDGDPVELEIMTGMARGKRSRFREVMAGLLTPAEYDEFLQSTEERPWKGGAAVKGRVYNVKIGHSETSGWPKIVDVIGPVK